MASIKGGKVDAANEKINSIRLVTDTNNDIGLGDINDPIRVDPTGTTVQPVSFNSAQHVIVDSGAGGGTQYADGATQATPTGTVALGKNASNVVHALSLDGSGNLNINLAAGSISGGNAAASATGSAVPANAGYTGFNSGGNLVGVSSASPLPVSLASLPALAAGSAVIGHVINDASSAVIGHVIADTGSTTAVTGNVTAVQATGTNLHVVVDTAPTTAVTIASLPALTAGSAVIGHVIVDTAPSTAVTNAGTFATQATLAAETTKVIGTARVVGNVGGVLDAAVGTLPTNNFSTIAVPTAGAGAALSCVLKVAQASAVNIKASAGNLYGFAIVSATATAGFVQFFNTATTATSGAVLAVPIAASGTIILTPSQIALLNFSTGIAINVSNPINTTTTQITWTGCVWFL